MEYRYGIPPFASCSTTSPSHRVDQAVDCGLWNVVPLLFNRCARLLDIGGNWNTLIQSIPNSSMGDMSGAYAGHGRTGTFSASRNCDKIYVAYACLYHNPIPTMELLTSVNRLPTQRHTRCLPSARYS